jgi:DME family drug/metabolite transporter
MVGAGLLYLFHHLRGKTNSYLPNRDLWLGALGIALYQITFFSAVKSTGVAIGTVTALGSAPALTGLIAYFITGEKPSRKWFPATTLTMFGIIILTTSHGLANFNLRGFLLAIGAGASYSFFAVATKRALKSGVNISELMYRVFALAALISSPLFFSGDSDWIETPRGIAMVLWLGLIPTAVAYIAYSYGLKKVKASTASTLILAEPATATLLAAVVLGESINVRGWLGFGVVVAGLIYLSI